MEVPHRLLTAALFGQVDRIKELLKSGLDVNGMDLWGHRALSFAAMGGQRSAVETLLSHAGGAAVVDAADVYGRTALHEASENGFSDIADDLLKHGANANLPNADGRTSLHLASAGGHGSIVVSLIRGGSRVDALDKSGCSPIDLCRNADIRLLFAESSTKINILNSGKEFPTPSAPDASLVAKVVK